MLESADTVEEAIQLARNVAEVHKNANFHIRNWKSNSSEVLAALGEKSVKNEYYTAAQTIDQLIEPEKVLGMWWRTTNDTFTFSMKFTKASAEVLQGNKLPTKRELLRIVMFMFDPLGLLSYFTINVKILMQDVWRSCVGWDDKISDELSPEWKKWLLHLPKVEQFTIPRCYFGNASSTNCKVELHLLTDASERASASVAYFRCYSDSYVNVSLICGKTKVAPLKPTTIPRVELVAALIGARLANLIKDAHDLNICKIFYWTDSKTVLAW